MKPTKILRSLNSHFLILALLSASFAGHSQQIDTTGAAAYENLSLKDLLEIKIVSVSKNSELLFDAPLSASVLMKEDIQKAGCTSVMEALRLVPGMIVREQTNGNYDIYLRGMNNAPPNAAFEGNSTTTLVMLDNRPIYNYLKGGTYWETLPVDINDVERIEVIRGPAAALYGPNAVSGVINIITRELKKPGLSMVANAQQGSNRTIINNASAGYRFNSNWSLGVSGNYQGRNRTQISYYDFFRNQSFDHPDYLIGFFNDTIRNIDSIHPYQERAMEKYAGNVFVKYAGPDNVKLNVTAGSQHSIVQKVSTENAMTPLSTVRSDSRYADFTAHIHQLTAQLSYNTGTQISDYQAGNKYDFNTFDANLEYNYIKGNFSLKPGISYRNAVYDDTKYSDIINKAGIFNARGKITTRSASLRSEYKLLDNKMRIVAGIMGSHFNYPDSTYLSYELAVTYKLNTKYLVRAVYSSAPRSSNIFDNYVNQRYFQFQTGDKKYMSMELQPNKSLRLLTANMIEIGYRGKISSSLQVDAEIFHIRSKNYSALLINAGYETMNGPDTIAVVPLRVTNLPLTLLQKGITVSLTYTKGKLQVSPFVTFQKSTLGNYTPYMNTPDAPLNPIMLHDPAVYNIYSGSGNKASSEGSPAVFGGATLNYSPYAKWVFNLNVYYSSRQTYYHVSNTIFMDGVRGVDHIPSKTIVNARVSYEPVSGLKFFCSGKNLLCDNSREFFQSDNVGFMLLGGLNFEL